MPDRYRSLDFKKIFLFWLPLAATWLMMSVEGPFLSAIIARMNDPKFNLAAYGVAFSFALIVEAPVIMIMSASTALISNFGSYRKLRNFTFSLNLMITLFMLILLYKPIFNFLTLNMIKLPIEVSELTYTAVFILLPWPAAIGFRRFYQGILIRGDKTRRVAYGTMIRLMSMSATAVILFSYSNFDGVIVGASALSVAVVTEAIASKFMVSKMIREIKYAKTEDGTINYREIIKFYYPLALTSILSLGIHPIVTFFMGQSYMALESLAVLPVINSLVFIFRSIGLSFQEVGIALMGRGGGNYFPIRNFALIGGTTVVFLLALITATPLSYVWFHLVSGLSVELTSFAKLPAVIMSLMPGLTFLISFQRSVLMNNRTTTPITYATLIEVLLIISVLFSLIGIFNTVGAVAATAAYIIGRLGANLYLIPSYRKAVSKISAAY